jgi:hypothetical protein
MTSLKTLDLCEFSTFGMEHDKSLYSDSALHTEGLSR